MSLGYEVCIHRDGRWEVYSFFDNDQENDAIYQARDISNNYQAVCVLWPSEMRIIFFNSKNKDDKKPSYMDVRGDLKLSKKRDTKPFMPPRMIDKKQEFIPPQKKIVEDPYFTEEDKKNLAYKTVLVGFMGLFFTIFAPSLFGDDLDSSLKGIIAFISFFMCAFITVIFYKMGEDSIRLKSQKQDFDHEDSWKKLGLSADVLEKLKKEQTPEMKKALSQAIPFPQKEKNISNSLPQSKVPISSQNENNPQLEKTTDLHEIDETQALETSRQAIEPQDNNTQRPVITAIEDPSKLEKSERIQAAIKARPKEFIDVMALLKNQENVDFKMPEDLSDINMEDPQLRNALAEASVREVLAEMCDTIKDISYSKDGMELFKNHEIAAILYLAGATSFMVKHLNLPTKLIREMVPLILTRLDVNPEISTAIMGQLGHYIHTPRHVILFDRGVTDAKMRIENTTVIYTYEDVLNQWLTLNEGVEPNGFFTAVLFTDIEDFTAQTQNKGESWMIDVLHAHNDIIRQILNALSGNEIKHTGDGILATFSNVHKALQAAVTIQRGVDIFCKAMPNRSFKIRIGISAGDIISIDNDIFGAPVNLAARIMNQIKGGQIVTTDQVYGMTHESDFNYENQGEVELKGLQPQQIYLLNWQEGIEQQEASTNLVKDLESKT